MAETFCNNPWLVPATVVLKRLRSLPYMYVDLVLLIYSIRAFEQTVYTPPGNVVYPSCWLLQLLPARPQWQCCQSSCHLCWCCHCPSAQSVQWCMQWCTRDCRGAELIWEVVSCAAPLSCPSPFCEAGLLPPSMQGKGTVSKQVQKGRGHQQGRRRRTRERKCRLTQPTCPLRRATSHKRASTSMCQVEEVKEVCL